MQTKSLTLFYELTQKEIKAPNIREIERKERWIKDIQQTVEADWKPIYIKVKYEIFNPEIGRQLRFFNGTVVKYYCIQNEEMTSGVPDNAMLKDYRELILDEVLGYDMNVVGRTIRKRKSTTDFKTVQAWNKFLNTVEETIFAEAGFDFPDSEEFWTLVKEHGYQDAERISVERLQFNLSKKLNK